MRRTLISQQMLLEAMKASGVSGSHVNIAIRYLRDDRHAMQHGPTVFLIAKSINHPQSKMRHYLNKYTQEGRTMLYKLSIGAVGGMKVCWMS